MSKISFHWSWLPFCLVCYLKVFLAFLPSTTNFTEYETSKWNLECFDAKKFSQRSLQTVKEETRWKVLIIWEMKKKRRKKKSRKTSQLAVTNHKSQSIFYSSFYHTESSHKKWHINSSKLKNSFQLSLSPFSLWQWQTKFSLEQRTRKWKNTLFIFPAINSI